MSDLWALELTAPPSDAGDFFEPGAQRDRGWARNWMGTKRS